MVNNFLCTSNVTLHAGIGNFGTIHNEAIILFIKDSTPNSLPISTPCIKLYNTHMYYRISDSPKCIKKTFIVIYYVIYSKTY